MENSEDNLSFSPVEVLLKACGSERFLPGKPENVNVKLDMSVVDSRYAESGRSVQVSTTYTCELFAVDESGEESPYVVLSSAFELLMETNRALLASDADRGALEPARVTALSFLHSYHVQKLENLGLELIQQAIPFPLTWESTETE